MDVTSQYSVSKHLCSAWFAKSFWQLQIFLNSALIITKKKKKKKTTQYSEYKLRDFFWYLLKSSVSNNLGSTAGGNK